VEKIRKNFKILIFRAECKISVKRWGKKIIQLVVLIMQFDLQQLFPSNFLKIKLNFAQGC
jgi:hypothetical protein